MSTKERLAAVLDREGLHLLAVEARAGRFDDFESPSATPIRDLVEVLHRHGLEDLAQRAIAGEWDGTAEEAQVWYEWEGRGLLEEGRCWRKGGEDGHAAERTGRDEEVCQRRNDC